MDWLNIFGSLALLVFGLKMQGDGIQKLAGGWLKKILLAANFSQSSALFSGIITTTMIQSSSSTIVVVVNLVNSGLMRLRQAIAVIMGANIGTTSIGWILLFFGCTSWFEMPHFFAVLIIGVPMVMMQSPNMKSIGEFLVGFSLMFVGFTLIVGFLPDLLHKTPEVVGLFENNRLDVGTILGLIAVGALFSLIVHSSGVTLAITLVFIHVGMPFEMATAVVLGQNIGTTISPNIAALRGNVHAKRAAWAHILFNVVGVSLGVCFFHSLSSWSLHLSQSLLGSSASESFLSQMALCLFHSGFNVLTAALLFGFTGNMAVTLRRFIMPRDEHDDEFNLSLIGSSQQAGEVSILEAEEEVFKMAKTTSDMLGLAKIIIETHDFKKQKRLFKLIDEKEDKTDALEHNVAKYLTQLNRDSLSTNVSARIRVVLSMITDIERIGDLVFRIALLLRSKNKEKVYFVPEQRVGLLQLLHLVEDAHNIMLEHLKMKVSEVDMERVMVLESAINDKRKALRKKHLIDLEKSKYTLKSGMFYTEVISSLERIGDHIVHVSEALKEDY